MPKFESLGAWIEDRWGTQGALAAELEVAQNTVSQWMLGKSRPKPPMQKKLRSLGYDGPFTTQEGEEVTSEDLQGLGRDLARKIDYAHEDLKRDIQALAAIVQAIAKKFSGPK